MKKSKMRMEFKEVAVLTKEEINVHCTLSMKQFSSTEARKHFFKLLDSAVQGQKVVIERKGVLLRLVPASGKKSKKTPDYGGLIQSDVGQADRWTWDWQPSKGLRPKKTKK